MRDLNWIKEIDYAAELQGEDKEIAEKCGIDVLIALWQHYMGMQFYVSGKSLSRLKKKYIIQNKDKYTTKELARKFDVTERYVYDTIASQKPDNQMEMF